MELVNKTDSLQLFELSENKVIRERQLMLKVTEVKSKLTAVEGLITEATTKMTIKETPEKALLDQINILVPMICKDLGIVKWNDTPDRGQYTKTRFYQTITRYYSGLSVSSLKLAFDMLAIGQLDEYLPKDRFQQPEKNHFGEFSFEFYCRILNAFVKKSADVWGKVRLSLPKQENVISLEEQNKNTNFLITELYEAFDNYKANKVDPDFHLEVHINYLISLGLIEKKKYTSENVEKAYNKLLLDTHISKLERKKMISEYGYKRKTHKLEMEAQRIQNNKTIASYFDKLILKKIEIKEILKFI